MNKLIFASIFFLSLVTASFGEDIDIVNVFPSGVVDEKVSHIYFQFNKNIVEKEGGDASEFLNLIKLEDNSCTKIFWIEKNILVCELRNIVEKDQRNLIHLRMGGLADTDKILRKNIVFDLIYKDQIDLPKKSISRKHLEVLSVSCSGKKVSDFTKRELFLDCSRNSEISFEFSKNISILDRVLKVSNRSRNEQLLLKPKIENRVVTFILPETPEQLSFEIDRNILFSTGESLEGVSEFYIKNLGSYDNDKAVALSKNIPESKQLDIVKNKCVVGEKSWAQEGIEICPREFLIEIGNGLKDNLYSFNTHYSWECKPKEECLEPEEYVKPLKRDMLVLGYGGVSSAKWLSETSESDPCGDTIDYHDEETGETVSYKPTVAKNVESFYRLEDEFVRTNKKYSFTFALHSFGALEKNENYEVTDIFSFDGVKARNVNIGEALSFPMFQGLINELSFSLDVSLIEKNGYKIITAKEIKGNPEEKVKFASVMIDPEGNIIYSWKADNYDCEGSLVARSVMKINGHTVVVGNECDIYFPDMTFMLVKVKSKYLKYRRYSNYSVC